MVGFAGHFFICPSILSPATPGRRRHETIKAGIRLLMSCLWQLHRSFCPSAGRSRRMESRAESRPFCVSLTTEPTT
ncbi:hypothetical protein CGRA01v4_08459 [Colletotrichum graminicola]|nr:hypothetical protein CGRA01v4_08459 [Colletotrichum graminicola]